MATRSRRFLLAAGVALLAITAGCTPMGSDAGGTVESEGPPVNWDSPVADAVAVGSTEEARPYLAFAPREPRSLGNPVRRLMTRPGDNTLDDKRGQALLFIYDSPAYGRVVVAFSYNETPLAQWESGMRELAAANDAPGHTGTAEVVSIRGGTFALITTAEDGSRSDIGWREGTMQIVVAGPALKREDCLTIAQDL